MPLFGWDTSHYDGTLTNTTLVRAKAEGISFFTAKIGEGLSYDDVGDATALSAARNAGIEFVGGYFVPRSGNTAASEVDYMLRLADRDEPWWRNYPGWFFQVDLERWPYDNVSATTGIAFAQEVRRRTGRWTILYASNGQYGGSLTGWDGPLWNAHYTTNSAGGFVAMYPGDNWRPVFNGVSGGWAAYSGREPTILQYTSSATIAGLTTCDANAYRGTADQMRAMIEGTEMEQTDTVIGAANRSNSVGDVLADASNLRDEWYTAPAAHSKNPPPPGSRFDLLMQAANQILAAPQSAKLDAILASLSALGVTLGNLSVGGIDVAALASNVAGQVIAAHDALNAADAPVIQAAVLDALRKGTGPTS